MRSLFKISLAVLALGILVVAGSAQAQDSGMQKPTLQITGTFNAAFGMVSYDKNGPTTGLATSTLGAYSEWITSYEHRIRFIYGTDELTGKLVLRPRGTFSASDNGCTTTTGVQVSNSTTNSQSAGCGNTNSNGGGSTGNKISSAGLVTDSASAGSPFLADIYGVIQWKPVKALMIEFGRIEGISSLDPIAGGYIMANPILSTGEYWMTWTGANGIHFRYDLGFAAVGLGVSNACNPQCTTNNYNQANVDTNGAATIGGVPVASWENALSLAPYIDGKAGDIGYRASYRLAQGDLAYTPTGGSSTTTRTESGSGYDIGASWSGMPGVLIAADIQSFDVAKDTTLCQSTATNACKDWQRNSIVAKFQYQAAELFYYDQNTDSGTGAVNAKQENTYYRLRYVFPIGAGNIAPEYTQGTFGKAYTLDNGGSFKDRTNSMIRMTGTIAF